MGFYKNKSVLVCGGAGLLGQALIPRLLAEGANVRATVRATVTGGVSIVSRDIDILSRPKCDVYRIDFQTADQDYFDRLLEDIDIVFWCAAKVGGARAIRESPSDLIIYNLNMTSNFMNMAAGKVDRFAFVSSSYVYPDLDHVANIEEHGFLGDPPDIHYGLGWIKRYLETMCRHFQLTTETKFAIIRPTNYFGPHDNFDPETSHVVPALVRKAIERQDPFEIWGDGTEQRCFTYVDDVAEGLMHTVEICPLSLYGGPAAINICMRKVSTVEDVAHALFEIVGFRPDVKHMLNKPTTIPYKVSDPSKAEQLLGFKCETTLKSGLEKTVSWYKAHGK